MRTDRFYHRLNNPMCREVFLTNGNGFTLFELMIIISIMSIIAVISIPNFLLFNATSRLNGAARQVAGDLMAARMEAIKQNCNVIVNFENSAEYYIVVDKNSNNIHDVSEPKITKNLYENYPKVGNIKPDTKNIFNSKGASRRMRTIILENPSGTVNIRVSISGRVKIDKS